MRMKNIWFPNIRDASDLSTQWEFPAKKQPILKHYDPKCGEEVSVRITLKEGVYELNTNKTIRRYTTLEDMPFYIQKAIAVLSISEPEYHLKGVGRRLHNGRFWIYVSARKTMRGDIDEKTQQK